MRASITGAEGELFFIRVISVENSIDLFVFLNKQRGITKPNYVTVMTGNSVVIFTNSGEVPTRPSGIFSTGML